MMTRSAIRCLLAIACVVSLPSAAHAFTTVGGVIDIQTDWPEDTYHVTSSITVQIGVELTIAPGSVVKFAPGAGMTINGSLDATGVNPAATYPGNGTYTIALRVTDPDGGVSDVVTTTVEVTAQDVRFTNSGGVDVTSFRIETEGVFVTAGDFAQAGQPTVAVTLTDAGTGDSETLLLQELGGGSGAFRNTTGFVTADVAVGVPENGVLETQYGSVIQVEYGASSVDTARMAGRIPIAIAGPDQMPAQQAPVSLDGSASFDPDGGAPRPRYPGTTRQRSG